MDRRAFLAAAAGTGLSVLTPELALARSGMALPAWAPAVTDIEGDLAPRPLKRVHGRAPKGLKGVLFRNGPAKFRRPGGDAGHWFDGDGLVRAFRIGEDGQARVSARFVDTFKRRQDEAAGMMVSGGFGTKAKAGARVASADDTNCANTALLAIGGELLALWEAGSPYALDPETLATRGLKTFRPDLAHMPFLAHPRVEPGGRVWNLGLAGRHAFVWTLNPDGSLERTAMIQLPRASYIHDFTATERHLVIVLQPWIQDKQTLPFKDSMTWRPDLGTQVLVLDKDDLTRRRVFELPPFFCFHLGDAWAEQDGTIHFDACISDDAGFAAQGGFDLIAYRQPAPSPTRLALVTLHADGKADMMTPALPAEFPKADPRFAGHARRRTAINTVDGRDGKPFLQGVAVADWKTGKADVFDFGEHQVAEEMVFVPRPGARAEMDGWLVGTSVNLKARATELHVFDAGRVSDGPVVTWRADLALPMGFHGTFVG